ncbi:MAG: DUF58 domain-containing protein, partial [Bacteroidia bacterium]|nr:DUF58 domain-containing protein [Bacteroidia bacterium]
MEINLHEAHQNSHLELLAKQVVEGFITGLHKSPFHGFSVEFAEHRIYNEGESTKNIDWKLFARTEKLFSKRYEEETNLRCQLVIDNSSSMHYPDAKSLEKGKRNKIMFSVHAAASIMNILKRQRDAVGMSVFSDKVEEHTPARSSTRHHKLLIHTLEQALASSAGLTKKTSAASAIHEIAENVNKRSLVLIFSDMMDSAGNDTDELFNALQHLKYNKHEVILFHVVDKEKEIDFDFENRPYQFIDVET